MNTREPAIIKSILDNDDYKFKMGQVVFHDFPEAVVTYEFTNRGQTPFPEGFAGAVLWQIEMMSTLALTYEEYLYLQTIPGMRLSYIEWLMSYRFDPGEVVVQQEGNVLRVSIKGKWFRAIFWEVPLMAIISELFFKLTGKTPSVDTNSRIIAKAKKLSEAGCLWADFGTRRRFDFKVQDAVCHLMKGTKGFLGTSNVYLAMKHGIKPIGTSAHEMVMGISAKYGETMANREWNRHWSNHYQGLNGIALTDTFTTDVFLRDWDSYYARLFDGVRQDSGDPSEWGRKMLDHYKKLGIDTHNKTFVFSDGLDPDTFIRLTRQFCLMVKVVGGIGTNLTNDCGHKALNMVIKLKTADFGQGPVEVVKLSDNTGKHAGNAEAIARIKSELRIV